MLRIITANLNGIRAAARKGFFEWAANQNADVICLQEIKAQDADLKAETFQLAGYQSYFHYADKKGYSGVGIYTRHQPKNVVTGLGFEVADLEGRYVAIDLGKLWVASLYLPSGTSGEHRQTIKYDFLDRYETILRSLQQNKQEYIICGDWNIAHKNIDLKNWRSNQKNSGFLPEERAWLDKLFGEMGFVDAFREVNQAPDQYTWWSHRGRAREKNVGWRIDYQITTPGLKPTVKSAFIYKDQRFSDHAPLLLEYDIVL
ncbi:MAG: exodeoxyribonuclease III [Gammaproteobacteria bacterium RIFCSPHIGHO2_12_FULL_43_28]|nr:MAG: exodeoxyribonuclease III [Gammaproteobacteria bacterium RIFCSPHIGHO2_12_FULL_43_28]